MAFHQRLVDYHVHSTESCDARSSIFEMCQKSINLGMVEIGFSEHVDFDPSDRGYGFFNYDRYSSEIEKVRKLFKNRLVIRKGVEIDYQNKYEKKIKEWLESKRFDYKIGAVHYVAGKIIDMKPISNSDLERLYPKYFNEVINSVESRLFDVVGHLDCMLKQDNNITDGRTGFDYWEEIQTVLEEIMNKQTYLEVNTKLFALRRARAYRAEMIPNKRIVQEYLDKGGKLISVGSDAHSTTELGCGIDMLLNYLDRHKEKQFVLLFSEDG